MLPDSVLLLIVTVFPQTPGGEDAAALSRRRSCRSRVLPPTVSVPML